MEKKQIKQILDDAPEGATHYLFIGQNEDIVMYYKWSKLDEYLVFKVGEFVDGFRPIKIIHNLSDLRTQLALIEENEKLKAALEAVANWHNADKDQVEHCVNVLKELSND